MTMLDLTQTEVEVETPAIPDAIVANARELDDLRTALKALEEREKALRASILDYLVTEGVDSATDGTVSISRSAHDRKGIDRAKMEALYPKVLAAVQTVTRVEQVRVKIKG